MPKFQRVPCCSLRLWEPAPDPDGRDGSRVFFGIVSQEFAAVNRGLSSAHVCSLFRETAPRPRPWASCTSRRLTLVGKNRPNTRSGFSKEEGRTLNPFLWKRVDRAPRTMSQLRPPPNKPTLLTMLRPGPLDQVFIHLSTPWERHEVFKQRLKRLALTWVRCVHR